MGPDAVGPLTSLLFPLTTVVMPNLPRPRRLPVWTPRAGTAPAERLVAIGATAALVTGGHGAEPAGLPRRPKRARAYHRAPLPGGGDPRRRLYPAAALAAGLVAWLTLADVARQAAVVAADAVAQGLAGLGWRRRPGARAARPASLAAAPSAQAAAL